MSWSKSHLSCPQSIRALLVLGLVGFLSTGCEPIAPEVELRVRKNVKHLSAQEKKDLVDAILALKHTPPPAGIQQIVIANEPPIPISNYYDMFVAFHQAAVIAHEHGVADSAHHNPAFPPWHRKLLLMYEKALQEVSGKDITLPYWDWTDEESKNAVFSVDFMGPAGDPNCQPDCPYAVVEGRFRKGEWELTLPTRKYTNIYPSSWTWLVRAIGRYDGLSYPVSLPTAQDIQTAMSIEAYDAAPYDMSVSRMSSFRNYLEGFDPPTNNQYMHNIVHDWVAGQWKMRDARGEEVTVAGTMEPLDISPSDPVFFLHHANVDRVWAQWQKYADGRMGAYVPHSSEHHGWNREDKMYPFSVFEGLSPVGENITPGEMLDFEALGYTYDDLVD